MSVIEEGTFNNLRVTSTKTKIKWEIALKLLTAFVRLSKSFALQIAYNARSAYIVNIYLSFHMCQFRCRFRFDYYEDTYLNKCFLCENI
jgi:hypothetical protein